MPDIWHPPTRTTGRQLRISCLRQLQVTAVLQYIGMPSKTNILKKANGTAHAYAHRAVSQLTSPVRTTNVTGLNAAPSRLSFAFSAHGQITYLYIFAHHRIASFKVEDSAWGKQDCLGFWVI